MDGWMDGWILEGLVDGWMDPRKEFFKMVVPS